MSLDFEELRLEKINSEEDFWCLFDELIDDKSNFVYNRCTILKAYKEGKMYGLTVDETEEMYQNQYFKNHIFTVKYYLLPCFCIIEDEKVVIIWTHTRARKKGFASKLLQLLNIKYVYNPLPESLEFWKKRGFIV